MLAVAHFLRSLREQQGRHHHPAAHFSNNAPPNLLVAAKYSRFLHRSSDPRRLLLRISNRSLQFSEILICEIASPGRKT